MSTLSKAILDATSRGTRKASLTLAVIILVGATGWLGTTDWFFGSDFMEEAHEILANLMLALAGLHILGVIHASWRHRENLVLSMVTGRKRADD